jgi:hypothetical protein
MNLETVFFRASPSQREELLSILTEHKPDNWEENHLWMGIVFSQLIHWHIRLRELVVEIMK